MYVHHAGDVNVDHRRLHEAVVTACRPTPGHPVRRILSFEVASSTEWQPPGSAPAFQPNWFVDISAQWERKRRALEAYAGEMRPWPHARSIQALEFTWAAGAGSQVGVEAAEAFLPAAAAELRRFLAGLKFLMVLIQARTATPRKPPGAVTDVPFLARMAPMGVATPLATTEAAMDSLPRERICTNAASRWLAHDPAEAEDRNQLLTGPVNGGRRPPQDIVIAARLHWRVLVIDQLEGSDNAYGSCRWFQRPGVGGQAPQDRLTSVWDPGDEAIPAIFELAQTPFSASWPAETCRIPPWSRSQSACSVAFGTAVTPISGKDPGQGAGRWNRAGDQLERDLASALQVAWALLIQPPLGPTLFPLWSWQSRRCWGAQQRPSRTGSAGGATAEATRFARPEGASRPPAPEHCQLALREGEPGAPSHANFCCSCARLRCSCRGVLGGSAAVPGEARGDAVLMTRFVIRCDASLSIGSGPVMRCRTSRVASCSAAR